MLLPSIEHARASWWGRAGAAGRDPLCAAQTRRCRGSRPAARARRGRPTIPAARHRHCRRCPATRPPLTATPPSCQGIHAARRRRLCRRLSRRRRRASWRLPGCLVPLPEAPPLAPPTYFFQNLRQNCGCANASPPRRRVAHVGGGAPGAIELALQQRQDPLHPPKLSDHRAPEAALAVLILLVEGVDRTHDAEAFSAKKAVVREVAHHLHELPARATSNPKHVFERVPELPSAPRLRK